MSLFISSASNQIKQSDDECASGLLYSDSQITEWMVIEGMNLLENIPDILDHFWTFPIGISVDIFSVNAFNAICCS